MTSGWRRWFAVGTGVGIEVAGADLRIAVVRLRPSGIELAGTHTIEAYASRPAAEWGAEYASFVSRHGAGHVAAAVLLPRRELTVRLVPLAGVADKDLESALALQVDSLHPYPDDDVTWTWSKVGSRSVVVAAARRSAADRYVEKMAEAGIKVSTFTFLASLLYSALRLYGTPAADGFLGLMETENGMEAYGESPARAMYSALYEQPWARAASLAASELRLPEETEARQLTTLIPAPRAAQEQEEEETNRHIGAYLAALASACPRLALRANLLPVEQRSVSSRWIYAPTFALGLLALLALGSLGVYARYEDRRYLKRLETEIRMLEPSVKRLSVVDLEIQETRARIALLDEFQSRTQGDLEALREATRVIAPPAWANTLELSRESVVVAGEAEQATGLLQALDQSAQFKDSEFMVPLARVGTGEVFRIRAAREGAKK